MKKLYLILAFVILIASCFSQNLHANEDLIRTLGMGSLNCSALSPDGTKIASAGSSGYIYIWDVNTGEVTDTLEGNGTRIESIVFCPDGEIIATWGNNEIILRNLSTGKELFKITNVFFLSSYSDLYQNFTFSSDGKKIATIDGIYQGKMKTIKIWDVGTGELIREISENNDVLSIAFHPDGTKLASSCDSTMKLWDINTGEIIRSFKEFHKNVIDIFFSPDGSKICAKEDTKMYSDENSLKLFDVNSGKLIRAFWGDLFSFSPDGNKYIFSAEHEINLYETETGIELKTFECSFYYIYSFAFSPDGKKIISAGSSTNRLVELWDVDSGNLLNTYFGPIGSVKSVAFLPDGLKFVSNIGGDYTIKLWEAKPAEPIEITTFTGHTLSVNSVAYSPDGKTIASGSADSTIKIWDINSNSLIRTIEAGSYIYSIAFSPDGSKIASGNWDSTIKLWDVSTGKLIREFIGHTSSVSSVAFSPDGSMIASSARSRDDYTVKLWNVNTGYLIRSFEGHTYFVSSVAFSPDGSMIASASEDKTVKLWEVSTGKLIREFIGHTSIVLSVAFSSDGSKIASGGGGSDETIKLWDVDGGYLLRTLDENLDEFISLSFSPEGTKLVSGDRKGGIALWDIKRGYYIRSLSGHKPKGYMGPCPVAFSSDGKKILSGGGDNIVKIQSLNDISELRTFQHEELNLIGFGNNDSSLIMSKDFDNSYNYSIYTQYLDSQKVSSELSLYPGSFKFDKRNSRLLFFKGGNTASLFDILQSRLIGTFKEDNSTIVSLDLSQDGSKIVTGNADSSICIWDAISGQLLSRIIDLGDIVTYVKFCPDGSRIATYDNDTIKVWDLTNSKLLNTFPFWSGRYSYDPIKFSPDGTKILATCIDGDIIYYHGYNLFDVNTGEEIISISGILGYSIAFCEYDDIVAFSSGNKTILYNTKTRKMEIRENFYSFSTPSSIFYSPDGSIIGYYIDNGNFTRNVISLYDLKTGNELHWFMGYISGVSSVCFNADKTMMATGSGGIIKLWRVPKITSAESVHSENDINIIAYPNPFSESTSINWELQTAGRVKIDIYNSLGEKITTLVDEWQDAGKHSAVFNVGANGRSPLQSGMYYYRILIGDRIESGKLLLII